MIGILGGTFDPVHFGHLRIALELHQELGMQEIRFVPCRIPPHRDAPHASAGQRLEMLMKAVEGQEGLCVDEREYQREGPSYTFDTLSSLREELGNDVSLCTIMGMDAFTGLDTWYRWKQLLDLSHIVVAHRPGSEAGTDGEVAGLLADHHADSRESLAERASGRILFWPVTQLDISSTQIRDCIASNRSARFLLPDPVLAIIRKQQIYTH